MWLDTVYLVPEYFLYNNIC